MTSEQIERLKKVINLHESEYMLNHSGSTVFIHLFRSKPAHLNFTHWEDQRVIVRENMGRPMISRGMVTQPLFR